MFYYNNIDLNAYKYVYIYIIYMNRVMNKQINKLIEIIID